MPTLRLNRPGNVLARRPGQLTHPKLVLTGDLGGRVVVPFGDSDSKHSGYGPTWEEVDRGAGRTPLLLEGPQDLRSQTRTWLISRAEAAPIDDVLLALVTMTDRRERVTISYGPLERGVWRMKVESITKQLLQAGTNATLRASVDVTFRQVNDPVLPPAAPPAAAAAAGTASATSAASSSAPRMYTVVRGDTLYALAVKFYGRGADWPRIADRNGIRDPRRVTPGTRLQIP